MARPEVALVSKAAEISKRAKPDDRVNRYMRLALWLAGKYRPMAEKAGVLWADLQGTALLALVQANKDYPKSKAAAGGIPFKAYMTTVIQYEVLNMMQAASMAYIPSRIVYKDVRTLTGAAARVQSKTGSDYATDRQLADELGWPIEKVLTYQQYARALSRCVDMDMPITGLDKEVTLGDALPDESIDVEEEVLARLSMEEERKWLSQATAELPPLTRTAMFLTFGLEVPEGVPGPTLGDVMTVALNHSASASRGLGKLREARQNDKGDMPELGIQDTSIRFGVGKSPRAVADDEARRAAILFWERSASGTEAPPNLERAGSLGDS